MDEKVLKWAEEHEGDEWCRYCRYSVDCNGGVRGGPNGTIYPPCADGKPEYCLDENAVLEAIEEGEDG